MRGGGSEVYGDGAVAGVVNIITKRSQPENAKLAVELGRGSYGMDDTRIHARCSATYYPTPERNALVRVRFGFP